MMNVLPPQEKKLIKQRYHRQLLFWALLFSGALFSASALLLVPPYVLAYYHTAAYDQEKTDNESRTKDLEKMRAIIENTNNLAGRIEEHRSDVLVSEIINSVWARADASIKITGMSYTWRTEEKKEGENKTTIEVVTLKISGQARERQALTAFATRLLEDEYFVDVDVPISNLAKDTNVPFELVVTLNTDSM